MRYEIVRASELPADVLAIATNPLHTPVARLAAWRTYEVGAWLLAVRDRGLLFDSLERPGMREAVYLAMCASHVRPV
ncbi:MAG: hypothetical protein ACREM8_14330 [Vulcanimicrobiaceae bacterium]